MDIRAKLEDLSNLLGSPIDSIEFASYLDAQDELARYRAKFNIPKKFEMVERTELLEDGDEECILLLFQLVGNLTFGQRGVLGHTSHPFNRPWVTVDDTVVPYLAEVVGAKPTEVAVMSTLTTNLHTLLTAFYKPTPARYKILLEHKAFPSDHYAVESQIRIKGLDPKLAMLIAEPRPGESIFRMEDIIGTIKEHGDSIALILLPGVQFYSGQVFDMKRITQAGHKLGCIIGFDLAHAIGNIVLELHDWGVDFGCWCTYKYLSSGPGNIGGLFVHENYAHNDDFVRLTGWWAHRLETRFDMTNRMELSPGAKGFQHSNPSVINCAALLGSLEIYHEVGMVEGQFEEVFAYLYSCGVICDKRRPNCIRLGLYPLINSFTEMIKFVRYLVMAI
ncbi:Kynureninase (L-kynurenine hydrolase), partial [Massospora cicadina]